MKIYEDLVIYESEIMGLSISVCIFFAFIFDLSIFSQYMISRYQSTQPLGNNGNTTALHTWKIVVLSREF